MSLGDRDFGSRLIQVVRAGIKGSKQRSSLRPAIGAGLPVPLQCCDRARVGALGFISKRERFVGFASLRRKIGLTLRNQVQLLALSSSRILLCFWGAASLLI